MFRDDTILELRGGYTECTVWAKGLGFLAGEEAAAAPEQSVWFEDLDQGGSEGARDEVYTVQMERNSHTPDVQARSPKVESGNSESQIHFDSSLELQFLIRRTFLFHSIVFNFIIMPYL